MTKKQTYFFATHRDLIAIAREVIANRPLEFVRGGLLAESKPIVLDGVDDLSTCEIYLVVDRGIPIHLRSVPQRTGGQKYAVDQVGNPNSVVLQTGGQCAERHLVAGQIGTVADSKQSDDLYLLFVKGIKSRFEKIKSFYVGPEAATMLDGGARLSATPKSPKTYDLAR